MHATRQVGRQHDEPEQDEVAVSVASTQLEEAARGHGDGAALPLQGSSGFQLGTNNRCNHRSGEQSHARAFPPLHQLVSHVSRVLQL